jgi:hypothetical protein
MTSWLTIKESECMEVDDQDIDEEDKIVETGIFKLRSNYTQGLSALHGSAFAGDESWMKSRHCFEEIILFAKQTTEETAAARTECTLILFLAYSNLSRMLANSEKKIALFYAIKAASVMNINASSIHDPGLLLRIARLTLSNNDFWSCKQIIAYNMSQNGLNGGLEESFHQLREDLNEQEQQYYNSSPSIIFSKKNLVKGSIMSLQIKGQVLETSLNPTLPSSSSISSLDDQFSTFNKLTILLDSQDQNSLSDYSLELCSSDSKYNESKCDIKESASVSDAIRALNSSNDQDSILERITNSSEPSLPTAIPTVVSSNMANITSNSIPISHTDMRNSEILTSFPLDTMDIDGIPNSKLELPHENTSIEVNKVDISTAKLESDSMNTTEVGEIDLNPTATMSDNSLSIDVRKGRSACNDSKITNDSTGN